MFPSLVADIGGTNARFAIVTGPRGQQFEFEHVALLRGEDFPNFEDAMAAYLADLGDCGLHSACIAIAGPIRGDDVKMTNLPWSFSQKALAAKFNLRSFVAINDFTAQALASSRIAPEGLTRLLDGDTNPVGNKAILGPGTGLGVAGLAWANTFWLPIASEGGHSTMPAANLYEAEILGALMRQHGYVSAETCVSGPGLEHLYQAVADTKGYTAELLEAPEISLRALNDSDALCREALELFCAFLGTVSSNFALTYGATGGVYLTGGILPRFIDFVRASRFEERFRNKGVMSHYMQSIPVDIITYEQTAFLGAAAWLHQHCVDA